MTSISSSATSNSLTDTNLDQFPFSISDNSEGLFIYLIYAIHKFFNGIFHCKSKKFGRLKQLKHEEFKINETYFVGDFEMLNLQL